MAEYLLGIDNGGTVSKVALFDLDGREVAVVTRKGEAAYPRPGWVERDMNSLWAETAAAIRALMERASVRPEEIIAIGNTGHGNGLYLIDRIGRPLRPGILALDTRAAPIIDALRREEKLERIWTHTAQTLWPGQTATLLRWVKNYEPDVYRRIDTALLVKDVIKLRLTGEAGSDFSDMSGTSLLDLYTRSYSSELLGLLGLGDAVLMLPRLLESTDVAGRVSAEAADETGLLQGTPVAAGIFDVSANALAAGVIEPGQGCITAGTWSINEVVTREPVANPALFQNTLYTPDLCLLLEASPTSATNLEWFVTQFCAEERAEAERRGVSVFEVCNEIVERLAPEGTTVIFHPFLFGSNVHSTAHAGFYGVAGWHTRDHLLRAVYEGVVYSHWSHIETLRSAGIDMLVARLTGGGARSLVWSQMFADALQTPIEVPAGREMGAKGAAMCAGIAIGAYRDFADAVARAVSVQRRHEPDAGRHAYYRQRYDIYRALAGSMRANWDDLAQL